ncbi:phthalate transporter [Moniliophthora roreri MCA 2997]|uniref:Phthalate transporter n=1 Tax=Moniliophthora roreri (strain MCA 2997) TaxID=1381753 RepID=V2XBD4_MONRO|nr:phthalate transporter [Moniliophthora roreri MCA 2997]
MADLHVLLTGRGTGNRIDSINDEEVAPKLGITWLLFSIYFFALLASVSYDIEDLLDWESSITSEAFSVCAQLLEAGYLPCALYYLAFWFRPDELAVRISVIYSVGQAGKIIWPYSQQLRIRLLQLNGTNYDLVAQVLISLVGWALLPYLPESPQTSTFLNHDQRRYVVKRLSEDAPTTESRNSSRTVLYATCNVLRQPLFWVSSLIWSCHAIPYSVLEFELSGGLKLPFIWLILPAVCSAVIVPIVCGFRTSTKTWDPFKIALGLQSIHTMICVLQIFSEDWSVRCISLVLAFSTAGAVYPVLWPHRIRAARGTIGTGLSITLTDAFARCTSAIVAPLIFSGK